MESLQDRSRSSSVTLGVSGGVGEGSFNGGANFNISKSRSDWVNEQTSLTAGGSVDIYVENKTILTGAVIASDPSAGSGQAGELRLDTGSFEYSHIKDREYSYNDAGELIEKTVNYLDDKGFKTDEEVKAEEAEKARQEAEAERKRLEEERNRVVKGQINGVDVDVRAGGLNYPESEIALVNQRDLPDEYSPAKACTFSVFYMAAYILSGGNVVPYAEAADNAKNGNPPAVGNNMSVSDLGSGVTKAAGADNIEVSSATYVGSHPKGGDAIDNNEASIRIINSLNKGELIHARVSNDPANMGHSILFTGYTVNPATGKVVITVNDSDGKYRYNYYDPDSSQLYKIVNNKPVYDEKRELIRYQRITKKQNK